MPHLFLRTTEPLDGKQALEPIVPTALEMIINLTPLTARHPSLHPQVLTFFVYRWTLWWWPGVHEILLAAAQGGALTGVSVYDTSGRLARTLKISRLGIATAFYRDLGTFDRGQSIGSSGQTGGGSGQSSGAGGQTTSIDPAEITGADRGQSSGSSGGQTRRGSSGMSLSDLVPALEEAAGPEMVAVTVSRRGTSYSSGDGGGRVMGGRVSSMSGLGVFLTPSRSRGSSGAGAAGVGEHGGAGFGGRRWGGTSIVDSEGRPEEVEVSKVAARLAMECLGFGSGRLGEWGCLQGPVWVGGWRVVPNFALGTAGCRFCEAGVDQSVGRAAK